MPADVQFRRIPVMFQERWIPLAKIYYTLEALGEEARLSPEVFTALHGKGLSLWQDKTFFDWAASQGLDRKKVEDMYNSFGIGGKVNRARLAAQAYQVQSVPLVIVDGKFVRPTASARMARCRQRSTRWSRRRAPSARRGELAARGPTTSPARETRAVTHRSVMRGPAPERKSRAAPP